MKLRSLLPMRGWVLLCVGLIAVAPGVVWSQSQDPTEAAQEAGQAVEDTADEVAGDMQDAAAGMQDAAGDAAQSMGNAANDAANAGEAAVQEANGTTSAFLEFFRKGGNFMWPLLLLSIVGLAAIIERFITLQKASTNTKKFIARIIEELRANGIRSAIEVCQKTRGPIAAIVHSGLTKADQGPAAVEKAIEAAGGIEVAFLQRGLMIMATVANVAPLVGFLGTVSGMINAFEAIAAAEQVSAKLVASGISEALITTMAGLVVAIPVQIFHNYFLARIDRFIIEMEESSIDLVNELEAGNIRP